MRGVSLLGISDASEGMGMRSMGVSIGFDKLAEEVNFPCIVHWKQNHFVVVYKIKKDKVYIADPAFGLVTYSKEEFLKEWISTKKEGENRGICLILEPTPDFYTQKDEKLNRKGFSLLFANLRPHRKFIIQLILGLLLGSLLQLIFPFLTQSIVDVGINNQDINFIYLIFIALFVLTISRTSVTEYCCI